MKSIFFLILLIFPSTSQAINETDSMRCKNGIVSTGDSMLTVINKCGPPAVRTGVFMKYKANGKTHVATEQWVFNFGPYEFQYYAYFDGATVALLHSTNERGF